MAAVDEDGILSIEVCRMPLSLSQETEKLIAARMSEDGFLTVDDLVHAALVVVGRMSVQGA